MRKIIGGTILLLAFLSIKASHIVGGYITYLCIGPDSYIVRLVLYRDCAGVSMSTSEYIDVTFQGCSQSTSITLNIVDTIEVSQLCPQELPNSACNGGNLPGIEQYVYEGILVIPPGCSNGPVQLEWSSCCKNSAIVNIQNPSSIGTTLITVFNPGVASCNNGVLVTSQPIPYVCVNQNVAYNYGFLDIDGDSVIANFTTSLDDLGNPVTYTPGYSATNPIPGIVLNPQTGDLTFTAPATTGNYVVTIIITQYDTNGNVIATHMQEMQVVVINTGGVCSPPPQMNSVSNLQVITGGAFLDTTGGNVSLVVCQGTSFCVDVTFSSTNPQDTLTLTSDVISLLPGATMTQIGTNPATAHICWNVPGTFPASNYVISIKAENDACPIPGIAIQSVQIEIVENTFAGYDTTICQGQSVQLNASGGTNFTWTSISGDPIIVGQNFSCNPCQNPVATPSQTTTYVVTSNLTGGCSNVDTITIFVVPDFNVTITANTGSSCLGDSIQFNATPSPSGTYQWQWMPPQAFASPQSSSTSALFCQPGTYIVTLFVTSSAGCIKSFTHTVNVANLFMPTASVTLTGPYSCPGDTAQLILHVTPTSGICPPPEFVVGTPSGQSTSTSYPTGYAHWYRTNRQQFLIRQSELVAAGVPPLPAKIKAIGFYVQSIPPGMNTSLPRYIISMGMTNVNSLTGFIPGTTPVYSAFPYNVTTGWNIHTLQTPFQWDGTSNLLIEVCSGDLSVPFTSNAICPLTTTPFTSTYYDRSDVIDVCTTPSMPSSSTQRPLIKIIFETPSGQYLYQWSNMPNIISQSGDTLFTIKVPLYDTAYSLIISDTTGQCKDTVLIPFQVNKLSTMSDTTVCIGQGTSVQLYASGTSYCQQGNTSYQWYPPSFLDNPASPSPVATFQGDTDVVFRVVFSDGCGCVLQDSFNVSVKPLPIIQAEMYPDSSCPPLLAQFTIDTTTATSCIWTIYQTNLEQGVVTSLSSCYDFSQVLTQHGYYTPVVVLENQYGCRDTIKYDSALYVGLQPEATFYYSPPYLTNISTILTIQNNTIGADSLIWFLPHDTLTGPLSWVEMPSDTGTYPITLIAISEDGCVDTITKWVEVKEEFAIWVPTAFTPDGDGVNDEFYLGFSGLYFDRKRFEIWIFDRWGEVVFYSQNPDFKWDGTHYRHGHKLPQGTYVVKIKAISKITNKPVIITRNMAVFY